MRRIAYRFLSLWSRAVLGIEISHNADIGPGLRIFHQGTIVIGAGVKIGARCRLRQGVTIGVATTGGVSPHLGDDVFIGVNAVILGPITVGDGATIAAGAVVLHDVPAHAVVGGVPARILTAGTPATHKIVDVQALETVSVEAVSDVLGRSLTSGDPS
jgi:serine acetyltransferase